MAPAAQSTQRLPLTPSLKPVQQLDRTPCEIAERFGAARREWVATAQDLRNCKRIEVAKLYHLESDAGRFFHAATL